MGPPVVYGLCKKKIASGANCSGGTPWRRLFRPGRLHGWARGRVVHVRTVLGAGGSPPRKHGPRVFRARRWRSAPRAPSTLMSHAPAPYSRTMDWWCRACRAVVPAPRHRRRIAVGPAGGPSAIVVVELDGGKSGGAGPPAFRRPTAARRSCANGVLGEGVSRGREGSGGGGRKVECGMWGMRVGVRTRARTGHYVPGYVNNPMEQTNASAREPE